MPLFGNGSGAGFFSDLKSTLGFTPRDAYEDGYDAYSDNFDDYSTYEDDYYDDGYGEVVERVPQERDYYERSYRPYGDPPLMTIDEVRRGVSMAARERRAAEPRDSYRSSDYRRSGSVEREAAAEAARRPARPAYADRGTGRTWTVLSPSGYDEAEAIARSLKAGESVVLDLGKLRSDLVKRILDFSFGAASVTGARVDCIASKVFAITAGGPITEGEAVRLRSQGVRL